MYLVKQEIDLIWKKKKKQETALDQVLQTLGNIIEEEKEHGDGIDKALEKVFHRPITKQAADKSKQQIKHETVKELNVKKGYAYERDGLIFCEECNITEVLRMSKMGVSQISYSKKDPSSIAEWERYCSKCGARIEKK